MHSKMNVPKKSKRLIIWERREYSTWHGLEFMATSAIYIWFKPVKLKLVTSWYHRECFLNIMNVHPTIITAAQ